MPEGYPNRQLPPLYEEARVQRELMQKLPRTPEELKESDQKVLEIIKAINSGIGTRTHCAHTFV